MTKKEREEIKKINEYATKLLNILDSAPKEFLEQKEIINYLKIIEDNLSLKLSKLGLLNETDLYKYSIGTLSRLTQYNQNYIKNIEGIEVFIQSHAYNEYDENEIMSKYDKEKIKSRNINKIKIRKLFTKSYDIPSHINEIITLVFENYKNFPGSKYSHLSIELKNIIISTYNKKEDKSKWKDDIDDIRIKFAIYRVIHGLGDRYYKIEGALGIGLSLLSYKGNPLVWIKDNDSNKWNEFIKYNEKYNIIDDLDSYDLMTPIINIAGYTTWIKQIDINHSELKYIPNPNQLNQDLNSKDVYKSYYNYEYPIYNLIDLGPFSKEINILGPDDKSSPQEILEYLFNFEKNRTKGRNSFRKVKK